MFAANAGVDVCFLYADDVLADDKTAFNSGISHQLCLFPREAAAPECNCRCEIGAGCFWDKKILGSQFATNLNMM